MATQIQLDATSNTNGGDGVGSSMTPTHGVLVILGTAAAVLVAIGILFR